VDTENSEGVLGTRLRRALIKQISSECVTCSRAQNFRHSVISVLLEHAKEADAGLRAHLSLASLFPHG